MAKGERCLERGEGIFNAVEMRVRFRSFCFNSCDVILHRYIKLNYVFNLPPSTKEPGSAVSLFTDPLVNFLFRDHRACV